MSDDNELALFGHSARSVEVPMFGKTRINIDCKHAGCDLTGSIASAQPDTARSIAALIIAEHYSQTETS